LNIGGGQLGHSAEGVIEVGKNQGEQFFGGMVKKEPCVIKKAHEIFGTDRGTLVLLSPRGRVKRIWT